MKKILIFVAFAIFALSSCSYKVEQEGPIIGKYCIKIQSLKYDTIIVSDTGEFSQNQVDAIERALLMGSNGRITLTMTCNGGNTVIPKDILENAIIELAKVGDIENTDTCYVD